MKRWSHVGVVLIVSVAFIALEADAALAHTAPTDDPAVSSYTVHAGDAVPAIARRFNTTPAQILQMNDLTAGAVIHPGDELLVPARTASSTVGTTGTAASTPPSTTRPSTTYTVKSGDALAGIAAKHGMSLSSLLALNGLTATSVIHPGQPLQVTGTTTSNPAPAAANQSPPTTAPATTTPLDTLVGYLKEQVGKPYKFFAAGPDSFDCSGLVVAGFRKIGIVLPHQSRALAATGRPLDLDTDGIRAGDLIFMTSSVDPSQIGHVGIALSPTTWIQAVGTGQTVRIAALPARSKIEAVRRIL